MFAWLGKFFTPNHLKPYPPGFLEENARLDAKIAQQIKDIKEMSDVMRNWNNEAVRAAYLSYRAGNHYPAREEV